MVKSKINLIDEDLISVIKPLYIMQNLNLSAQFQIKNNCIQSNTKIYNAFSVFMHFVTSYFIWQNATDNGNFKCNDYLPACLLKFLYYTLLVFEFMFNLYGIIESDKMVKVIIKINSLSKSFHEEKELFRRRKIFHWYCFCLIGIFNFCNCIIIPYASGGLDFSSVYITLTRTFFDVDVFMIIFIVEYSSLRIKALSQSISSEVRVAEMFEDYKKILQGYTLCVFVYSASIMFYVVKIFLHEVALIQSMIFTSYIKDAHRSVVFIGVGLYGAWIFKCLILLLVLCAKCTKLKSEVDQIVAVALALKNSNQGIVRQTCKNIVRLTKCGYRAIKPWGMFVVDSTLPLQLAALALTYTVVLLQFALL